MKNQKENDLKRINKLRSAKLVSRHQNISKLRTGICPKLRHTYTFRFFFCYILVVLFKGNCKRFKLLLVINFAEDTARHVNVVYTTIFVHEYK